MSKVGIVTDTTSCLPPELVKEYGIRIVPVGLVIGGKHYKDTELTNEQFWQLFYAANGSSTTAAPSLGDFTSIYEELSQSCDGIVCILVSKALSATFEVATQGKDLIKEKNPKLNIEIIDSKTSAGALGFIVLESARAAKAGKNLDEVVQVANDMIPRVKFVTAMDTLKYLIKIGRAPKTAVLGDVFGVKPLIGMVSNTGLVENLGRARGKKKAMSKIVELAKEHIEPGKPVHAMFHYTDSIAAGEALKQMVTSQIDCKEVYLTPYTPVMASATGPVVAFAFYTG
ncbi:MAG TPA: DegV family protein [Dehalococcoidia bacterium]|nr:DegV family protein [Dehalococcoidia bacterium]